MAAGYAQFSVAVALPDIAAAFGTVQEGTTVAAAVGLSATTLGIGLGIIRLASLGALPLASLADRHGRRRVLLGCAAVGLALTALGALSPSYWWFVAIFALGRPLLSAVNAVAGVIAAEETSSADRAKAIALLAAAYGTGSGTAALTRAAFGGALGFRGLFALALLPLLALPLLARLIEEPDRYETLRERARRSRWRERVGRLGAAGVRARILLMAALTFGIAFVTGPVNSYLFVYGERVLGMAPSSLAFSVIAAGPVGLAGLLLGRWASDRVGRRGTAGLGQMLVAAAGALTYSGGPVRAVGGYLLTILVASAYAPAGGALGAELFPTSLRSTAAGCFTAAGVLGAVGGLVAFGVLADLLGGFDRAALALAIPVAVVSGLYWLLPETMGQELEQSAPEPV
ncbi:MAG TPA: MFS transporter [Egibacteraceae bacterium]|nr:MFS transporter [Egibacteraceae bacterium]